MFSKIKKWNQNRKLAKEMKLTMHIAFYDYLIATADAKRAEQKAYESMKEFENNFNIDDFKKILNDVDKVVNNPDLQTAYYQETLKSDLY